MLSQDDAHRMAHSWWAKKRSQSISIFYHWSRDFPDKEQIWQDLVFLAKDKKSYIRNDLRSSLINAFKEIDDKESAWQDIHRLTIHKDFEVRCIAAYILGDIFDQIPNKETAWEDINRLIGDNNVYVQIFSISAIGSAFEHISNKEQAWEYIHQYTHVEDNRLRYIATYQLFSVFNENSFKERAWKDLHQLTHDKDPLVRQTSINVLTLSFNNIPDRELAWQDFHHLLINDKNKHIRNHALIWITYFFKLIPNKELAWQDLHVLANDKDKKTISRAIYSILHVFHNLTDKKSAWEDVYRAIYLNKINDDEKYGIVNRFGDLVDQIPDKNQLFKILHKLTKEKKSHGKNAVADSSFTLAKYYIEEKDFKMAYRCFDLASSALTRVFLKPLHFKFYYYKAFSYYYHGRYLISKLPCMKDPEEYQNNFKNAIDYFEKAIKYSQKYFTFEDEKETSCFPICLNIYSALYEINLSSLELDEKRLTKIENYLDNANNQCIVVGKEKAIKIVNILGKLAEALRDSIEEVKLESKRQEMRNKGKGYDARYITFIEKSRVNIESHFDEIDDLLNQLEAPTFKQIAEIETETLKKLRPTLNEKDLLPKSPWQIFYEFIKKIWKGIVALKQF